MNNTIKCLMATISASIIFLFGQYQAQAAASLKIGYVELKEVFENYDKAKEAEGTLKKDVETEKQKISQLGTTIKNLHSELEQKKDLLQPAEKAKKEAEIKEKEQEFSELWNKTTKALDAKRQELEENLLEEIKAEIKNYGTKNGFSAILDSRVFFFGDPGMDVTQEIIKALNKK